ncbi:MAG: phosphonate ABC transporter [Hyphomonadaceae bacterium]|nr:phosphonate ABC transporter [Hyphomonadaceae bacterium]
MTDEKTQAPGAPALELSGVFKSYKDGPAVLEDFSLNIAPGCFCVVLGSSGSGKSTLLKCIAGLTEPDAGDIRLHGNPLTRKRLRSVGMVHQDFGLSDRLTAAQNVMSGMAATLSAWRVALQLYPGQIQRQACALLSRVGLSEDHANRRASQLSGGQKQRVGIARALISDPSLILADEPVASLDPKSSVEIMTLLKSAAQERGAAVLCSLHQIDLARKYADRIIGLSHGAIVFDGPPAALTREEMQAIFDMDDSSTIIRMEVA